MTILSVFVSSTPPLYIHILTQVSLSFFWPWFSRSPTTNSHLPTPLLSPAPLSATRQPTLILQSQITLLVAFRSKVLAREEDSSLVFFGHLCDKSVKLPIRHHILRRVAARGRGMLSEKDSYTGVNVPVCVGDVEKIGKSLLPRAALDYYRSGAGEEVTLSMNREAFRRLRIRPRVLRDVSRRDLTTTVLGTRVAVPFGVSPTAMHRMAHPEGEVATARAAEKVGAVFILSTLSTSSLEEVAEGAPNATKWFQLYIYKKRDLTRDLVARAERLGFKALVLTVDAPVFGIRWADARNKFSLPPHLRLANFIGADESQGVRNRGKKGSQLQAYVTELFDQSLTWKDVAWLKSITKLPLILKGILTKEDTEEALKYDVAGIMVSNHGARQVDGFPATIEALPEILEAVNNRCDVYLDGGVTQGTDVFKALAIGAKMVFVGRPAIWGLAYNGEDGVKTVLEFIRNELDSTMALTGCANLKDIKPDMVVPASYYSLL